MGAGVMGLLTRVWDLVPISNAARAGELLGVKKASW